MAKSILPSATPLVLATLSPPVAVDNAAECFHCGLPVPSAGGFAVTIDGVSRDMCCPGCQAVASAIVDGGLDNFYRFRTQANERPAAEQQADAAQWAAFDLTAVQTDFVTTLESGERQALLLLDGLRCAACVWLIEHHLGKLPGVVSVKVNASTHRCIVQWQPAAQKLSELMQALAVIGYRPQPATDEQQQALLRRENRQALMRLGVAGFGMMQVGMVAIALYAGALQGISAHWEHYLRLTSWAIATPVILYSAQPFFRAAWRSVSTLPFSLRQLSMDVPVSIAIGGAYLASAWATLTGGGEVYFDSVSMFTFFLLLGRYLELRARHHNNRAAGNMAQLMPLTARRLVAEQAQTVPLKSLQAGDRVLVKAGETLPCDGLVVSGSSAVVEALLTGEPTPVEKMIGDRVAAGTVNSDSPLTLEVTAVGAATQLSAIERLVDQAAADKPQQVALADKLAGYFVAAVLVVAAIVFTLWWQRDSAQALWVTLSVLVVTCPCALSLATPAALTAATGALRRAGLLVTRGHVIESLPRITRVVFDKTGTLTHGDMTVTETAVLADQSETQVLAIAKALEQQASHPIAQAFNNVTSTVGAKVEELRQVTGAGVEGRVALEGQAAQCYRLGSPTFVAEIWADKDSVPADPGRGLQWILLGTSDGPSAWFALTDRLRPSARLLIDKLTANDIAVELLSGDKSEAVAVLAQQLGIDEFRAGVSPDGKLQRIRALQAQGERVLMVGDGINDVPVLSGADISVAMAAATDLAQTRADSVLLNGDLTAVARALQTARATRVIIGQNLGWALAYNGLALPLAALGWVPPYAAAIGMSASSLVVIANALRLQSPRTQ